MTGRRVAGCALLSTGPATFIALAALSGQLAELAVGTGIAAVVCLTAVAGLRLLDGEEQRHG